VNAFFLELFSTNIYKRTQGRITRQITFVAIAVGLAIGLWQLNRSMMSSGAALQFGVSGALLAFGLWATYRLVNVPIFADFLIAVEAEMNKVSWPTRSELTRASLVVLFTIFALAAILTVYDVFWRYLFRWLQIF
jgi:preprotein translocase subunit SecE